MTDPENTYIDEINFDECLECGDEVEGEFLYTCLCEECRITKRHRELRRKDDLIDVIEDIALGSRPGFEIGTKPGALFRRQAGEDI